MVSKTKILDKLSDSSFFLGVAASKIRYLPVNSASPYLNIASLLLYLLGYAFWLIASYFYPNQDPTYSNNKYSHKWYNFASFKELNSYAALLGMLASITSIAALALPVLVIPAVWIFFGSNAIWTISQYHRFKNPPQNEHYSESYQKSYFSYTLTMTLIGFTGAIASTLIFVFPPITIPALIVSTMISVGLGLLALKYWINFHFNNHKKSVTPEAAETSYNKITNQMQPSNQPEPTFSPEPFHGKESKLFELHSVPKKEEGIAPDSSWICNIPQ